MYTAYMKNQILPGNIGKTVVGLERGVLWEPRGQDPEECPRRILSPNLGLK